MSPSRGRNFGLMTAMLMASMNMGGEPWAVPPPNPRRQQPDPPKPRRVAVNSAYTQLQREISAHNEAVEARKLAKKAAKR